MYDYCQIFALLGRVRRFTAPRVSKPTALATKSSLGLYVVTYPGGNVGPVTNLPTAGETGRDWELMSSFPRQASPTRTFRALLTARLHYPDFVAYRSAALLPAELAAMANAITPLRVCAQRSCMFNLIQ